MNKSDAHQLRVFLLLLFGLRKTRLVATPETPSPAIPESTRASTPVVGELVGRALPLESAVDAGVMALFVTTGRLRRSLVMFAATTCCVVLLAATTGGWFDVGAGTGAGTGVGTGAGTGVGVGSGIGCGAGVVTTPFLARPLFSVLATMSIKDFVETAPGVTSD